MVFRKKLKYPDWPPPRISKYRNCTAVAVVVFLYLEILGGVGGPVRILYLFLRKQLLTGWHLELLGGGQSAYSTFFFNLWFLGGGQLKKSPCTYSKARHRLDGVVYAVKITKKKPKRNSRDEKVHICRHEPSVSVVEIPAYFVLSDTLGGSQWSFCPCCYDEAQTRSEVSIFSCLLQYKKLEELFSRYFNAWVESGHLHIQTEFCEGGSLEAKVLRLNFFKLLRLRNCSKVDVCIESDMRFSDLELRKILIQVVEPISCFPSFYKSVDCVARWPEACSTCTRRSWRTSTSSPPTSSSPFVSPRTSPPRPPPPSLVRGIPSDFLPILVQVLARKSPVQYICS